MTDSLLQQMDQVTQEVKQLCTGLTHEQFNWKLTPDSWSIGQIVEHLCSINESYYPILDSVQDGSYKTPFMGRIGFMVNFFGNLILKSVAPDNHKRTKTLPLWEPSKSDVPNDVLDRFVESQEKIKQYIQALREKAAEGLVINSPANTNVVYKLDTAFQIIVDHARRHLLQAQEVKGVM